MWCMWPLTADCYQFSQMLMYSSLPDFQTMKIRDQYTNLQISVLYITDKLVNVDNFVLKYWKVVRKIHQVALLTESCSRTKKLPKTWKVAEKLPSNLWKGLPPTHNLNHQHPNKTYSTGARIPEKQTIINVTRNNYRITVILLLPATINSFPFSSRFSLVTKTEMVCRWNTWKQRLRLSISNLTPSRGTKRCLCGWSCMAVYKVRGSNCWRKCTGQHVTALPQFNPFTPKSDQFQISPQSHQKYNITQYEELGFS